ncbi:JAB domain-containing protein [Margalitia sp. FSL K6-0131]|uniref:JAB domain-containing protein n=1 Tax=Margalitia sp. FSL K6-0131 TaxID=2954604 RepID=UPI0030F7F1FE
MHKTQKIYEVVRIKQEIKECDRGLVLEKIKSPEDGAKIAASFIGDEDREVFLVICLSTKNTINAIHRCHVGSINASIVHPREVFKSAILNNSTSIIVAHNHPSLDCTESREDVAVTQRLNEAGKILGIDVLDHLIVNAKGEYTSLKEKGYL